MFMKKMSNSRHESLFVESEAYIKPKFNVIICVMSNGNSTSFAKIPKQI